MEGYQICLECNNSNLNLILCHLVNLISSLRIKPLLKKDLWEHNLFSTVQQTRWVHPNWTARLWRVAERNRRATCVELRGWTSSAEGKEGPIKNEIKITKLWHNRQSTMVTYLTIRGQNFNDQPWMARNDPTEEKKKSVTKERLKYDRTDFWSWVQTILHRL